MIKNTVFSILFLILSVTVFSQVGVNTLEPNENSFLHISEQNLNNPKIFKGVLLAKYSQLERDTQFTNFTENEEGLIIYNLTQGCFNYWRHNKTTSTGVWTIYGECEDEGTINNLNCSSANINPIITDFISNYNGSLTIPYTNGNGGTYSSISIPSRGVTGLTITLSTGSFEIGNGELVFSVSGTPTSIGNAFFDIEIGGISCTALIPVQSLDSILSFDCQTANESLPKMNYNPNSAFGIQSYITYINGDGSAYNSYSIPSTGVTGLTLTIAAGNLAIGNGSIGFHINGRANSTGEARFLIEIGDAKCEIILTINEPANIESLNCLNPIFSNNPEVDSAYTGTMTIGYTNGNGSTYTPVFINSEGVTGLTMTLNSGTLVNGNGELVLNIRGTPSSSGDAIFNIRFLGKTCSVILPVDAKKFRIATYGNNGSLLNLNGFYSQIMDRNNYGPTGTYQMNDNIEIIDITNIFDTKTVEELNNDFQLFWFGLNTATSRGWTADQAAKVKSLADEGATMLIGLNDDFSNEYFPPIFSLFNSNYTWGGRSYSGGYGVRTSNFTNTTFGSLSTSSVIYGSGVAHASSYIPTSAISPDSTIYMMLTGSEPSSSGLSGSVGVWALNNYNKKVVFVWDQYMFSSNFYNINRYEGAIDSTNEIFSHNLFSDLLNRARGIE